MQQQIKTAFQNLKQYIGYQNQNQTKIVAQKKHMLKLRIKIQFLKISVKTFRIFKIQQSFMIVIIPKFYTFNKQLYLCIKLNTIQSYQNKDVGKQISIGYTKS
ncbi:unnamed protein product [Paramecium sonneborni]|uniref:Uncharacterized protein n=1 Tax=Paramecium sonneborni TaxID=65129 RepID=A0A8S1QBF2_9CILI|nr:unnamed protein product [Paramecium sonneborni]